MADSHHELPIVAADRATLEAVDFRAFAPLAGLPLAMTAHVVFTAIDALAPATTSATIVGEVIRGSIGFGGALMSDDISMQALSGDIGTRSHAAIAAGCDLVLHCNGNRAEMEAVAGVVPVLTGEAGRRTDAALSARQPADDIDLKEARRRFAAMMDGKRVPAAQAVRT
jgi:beta-N-acetylhexosaminidase